MGEVNLPMVIAGMELRIEKQVAQINLMWKLIEEGKDKDEIQLAIQKWEEDYV